MTISEFVDLVSDLNAFFSVHFTKKGTGEERTMLCRTGVTKGVKGVIPPGKRKEEDARCNVLTVYDINKPSEDGRGAFRRINLEQLHWVHVQGIKYMWDREAKRLIKV